MSHRNDDVIPGLQGDPAPAPRETPQKAATRPLPKRVGRSFQERNLVLIASVTLVVMVVGFFVMFNAGSLPLVGGGRTYHARFAEAAGLKKGDEVRLAGVKVGKVTGMSLERDKIMVDFQVRGVWMGDNSSAAINVKTLLGQKYLALTSAGREELDSGGTITKTTTPYDVTATLSQLSTTVDSVDTTQLSQSFASLSDAFANTSGDVQGALDGLTALSQTISSRDQQLADLLENTRKVSGLLADRKTQIAALIQDGNDLLAELQKRRDTIKALLQGTAALGTQLQGLVADNEKTLAPALANLDKVSAILSRNQANLDAALKQLGPYYRVLTSSLGNGRWLDSYVCGLFDANGAPQTHNDVARDCKPGTGGLQ